MAIYTSVFYFQYSIVSRCYKVLKETIKMSFSRHILPHRELLITTLVIVLVSYIGEYKYIVRFCTVGVGVSSIIILYTNDMTTFDSYTLRGSDSHISFFKLTLQRRSESLFACKIFSGIFFTKTFVIFVSQFNLLALKFNSLQ